MSHLFDPISVREITFKNRIVMSPMCMYAAENGLPNDFHLVHYGTRASGGVGLVMVEATGITPAGRISPKCLGIWNDEQVAEFKKITHFVHSQGSVAGIQLAHAGRKASTWGNDQLTLNEGGWETISSSNIPFLPEERAPKALTIEEIQQAVEDFKKAAIRAVNAGFKVIEIHAAHGYLIHQFLSPLCNNRTDAYGGGFDNRTRFLREVIAGVREVISDKMPLFVRISATDWHPEGWTPENSVQLANVLKTIGVDVIDCSSGAIIPHVKIPVAPLYQTFLAEKVKKESAILTAAVGLITTPQEAESIIHEERADFVFLARELLRDPYFALRAAHELQQETNWIFSYERGKWRK